MHRYPSPTRSVPPFNPEVDKFRRFYEFTSDPTVNDDARAGYAETTKWRNITSNDVFICLDNTVGAAIWLRITDPTISVSLIPDIDNTIDIGAPDKRWAHIYGVELHTGDLHMKSKDGKSDWTLVEQHNGIKARNNKTGKEYLLVMKDSPGEGEQSYERKH